MGCEENFFIDILSDHLAKNKYELCIDLDWDLLARYAHIHQVEGIVYYQCKDYMPEHIRNHFEQLFIATLYSYTNRKVLMDNVAFEFNKYDIPFFTVKGFGVARYYPQPELRTMGDCDIVVHRKDVPNAIDILQRLGFKGSKIISLQQWGCEKNGYYFEIHDRLVQEGEYASGSQASFFNNYDAYIKESELDSSFHFLYLLMHLRKHFLNHGVGIRQFMDLAVMAQYNVDLKWDWIEDNLEILGMTKYAHVCYALIGKWFKITIPVDFEDISNDSFEQITEKVLNNGVFGFDDNANRNANAHTALLKSTGPMWFRRIKSLLQSTFISYEIMRGYSDCNFVDGKPWLMPLAWGKRLVIILRRKEKKETIGVIKNSFIPQKELEQRKILLEKMGLL